MTDLSHVVPTAEDAGISRFGIEDDVRKWLQQTRLRESLVGALKVAAKVVRESWAIENAPAAAELARMCSFIRDCREEADFRSKILTCGEALTTMSEGSSSKVWRDFGALVFAKTTIIVDTSWGRLISDNKFILAAYNACIAVRLLPTNAQGEAPGEAPKALVDHFQKTSNLAKSHYNRLLAHDVDLEASAALLENFAKVAMAVDQTPTFKVNSKLSLKPHDVMLAFEIGLVARSVFSSLSCLQIQVLRCSRIMMRMMAMLFGKSSARSWRRCEAGFRTL